MAELPVIASKGISNNVETFVYGAGSYDRLKSNEDELFELVKLSNVPMDRRLFNVILELLKMNVAPVSILQVLKVLRPEGTTPDDIRSRSPVDQTFGIQTTDTASLCSTDSLSNSETTGASIPRSSHVPSATLEAASAATPDSPRRSHSSPRREKKTKSGQAVSKKPKSSSGVSRRPKDSGAKKFKGRDTENPR